MHPKSSTSREQLTPPFVFCACGCGQKTLLAKRDDGRSGDVQGQPQRYLRWHQPKGAGHPRYHGGVYTSPDGYRYLLRPDHPDANSYGYIAEHRLVLEQKVGRRLTSEDICHHVDGCKQNNHPDNLELMTRATHASLHQQGRPWSQHHDRCIDCGRTDRYHQARGRCYLCSVKFYQRRKQERLAHVAGDR